MSKKKADTLGLTTRADGVRYLLALIKWKLSLSLSLSCMCVRARARAHSTCIRNCNLILFGLYMTFKLKKDKAI